jgi:pimeloyl-ACP methyl ester carboxylesterase
VIRTWLLASVLCLLALAQAASADTYTSVKGTNAPGPSSLDRSYVLKVGPPSARHVLVLVPGTYGGAGDFRLVARDIVKRVPGLQVWAWDRRTQGLEDTSVFERGNPDDAFDYYLNSKPVDGRTFTPVNGAQDAPYAREWGLATSLEDLRRVVLKARAGGKRKVILGGHSLGGSTVMAYAGWDFNGRAGYRDLSAMVLIDGALDSTRQRLSAAQARDGKKAIDEGDPFSDLLGLNLPWAAGVFAETGALYARKAPNAPSPLADYPLLPATFKPPVRATNEAGLGYAFDESTSPPALGLLQVRAGQLAASGDPRGWQDGENSPIQRVARTFSTEPANGVEWYFPRRLPLDLQAAAALKPTPAAKVLGVRVSHVREVNVPLFAFGTDFTNGRVVDAARRFARSSKVPRATFAQARLFTHLDPLTAAPSRNHFLSTVVPFLKTVR